MKHTTFENELRDIRRRAINELRSALEAHGGSYDFTQYDKCPNVYDGKSICEARLHGNNIEVDTEDCYLDLDDFSIEEILSMTDYIVETDAVKDVSGVYPVPVTWVDTDDINAAGFNTEGLTQEELQKVADEMCDIYNNGDFYSDLDLACKNLKLKEKEG